MELRWQLPFSRNGSPTHLWGHKSRPYRTNADRTTKIIVFLPDVIFPEELHLESNLAQAMGIFSRYFNRGAKPCFRVKFL
ncbi:glycerol-3-phosphate dehydrogenase [Haemophilus influenzae]|uniref:Glycerol-3-phosphate dehydrogenase n=1 Tax=Haemophilus influenzae TaxID=727 RepID=A0A2X1QJT8_HAEIF|nr:glycerol-3-phosphate dehydrogenase [Haemophilus influenzae]